LSRRAGVTWRLVDRISKGHVPKVASAEKVSAATNGLVSKEEILGLTAPPAAPEAAE
jgi:hypothetical protein